jgi:hypothetical protein
MQDRSPQPTHVMDYLILVDGQHFLVLRPLTEEADKVTVKVDELLASHLIGVENLDIWPA